LWQCGSLGSEYASNFALQKIVFEAILSRIWK
jgi:hypothetical protein